jgi:hypothetical protein
MTQLYTSSRLRVLRECLRKHLYRYVLGVRTAETDSMRFGTIGHKALEAWYRAWMAGDIAGRLTAALAEIDELPNVWDRSKLRIIITAYHHRWGGEDWEVLAVEQDFRYLLGEHVIGGKIDAIIRDRVDGRVYVVEHKTTGVDASLGSAYWEKLTIDTQVSIYIDGAGVIGYQIAGCIYDVLKRPGHEPKLATPIELRKYTAGRGCKRCGGSAKPGAVEQGRGFYVVAGPGETPTEVPCAECDGTGWKRNSEGVPEAPRLHSHQRDADESLEAFEARLVEAIAEDPDAFLLRGKIVRLEDELPAMRQDVLDDIALAETGLSQRNSSACARFGRMCEFFDLCSGRASIDDEIRFPRGLAHPELEPRNDT